MTRVILVGMLLALLTGCAQATAPTPTTDPARPFVATPGPAATGMTVPVPTPNRELDPERTPVAITGFTIEPNGHEIVTITNISTEEHSIGEWSVFNPRTEAFFTFPADLTLQPGQIVRVHSGPGEVDSAAGNFAWSEQRQWTEPGEDIILMNAAGRFMFWYVGATG